MKTALKAIGGLFAALILIGIVADDGPNQPEAAASTGTTEALVSMPQETTTTIGSGEYPRSSERATARGEVSATSTTTKATTTLAPTTTTTTASTTTTTDPEPATTEPAFTRSEGNAIESAESYLDFSAFSRTGLIGQLEYEGFTEAEATMAVDHLDVDWDEQAWKSAESYLEFSSFSRSGLIEQLKYEGFSTAEATYGVDKTGL
jgi:Host cell surface-exposed lipoprotein